MNSAPSANGTGWKEHLGDDILELQRVRRLLPADAGQAVRSEINWLLGNPPATKGGYQTWRERLNRVGLNSSDSPDLPGGPLRPIPLGEVPAAVEFPVWVLPTPLITLCREVAWAFNIPTDFPGVMVLGLAAGAIGNSRRLMVKPTYPASAALWVALVGRPGTGKTPALQFLRGPLNDAQRVMVRDWERRKREWKDGGKDGDKPVCARCMVADTTTESLKAILNENPRGVLIVHDELAGLVAGLNQYKKGRGNDRQFYLSLWSGEQILTDRRSDKDRDGGPLLAERPFAVLLGNVTPAKLPFLQGGCDDDGWFDRFLAAYPDDVPAVGEGWQSVSDQAATDWKDVLDKLLGLEMHSHPLGEYVRPRNLSLTADGRAAWKSFTDRHAAEVNDDDFPDYLRGPWAKLCGYGARLALVIHLLRWACAEVDGEDVDDESVGRAEALVDYFKAHARRVLAVAGADGPLDDARKLWAWVVRERRFEFKRWEAHKDLESKGRFPTPDSLDPALAVLRKHNLIMQKLTDEKTGPGRRPDPTWEVNPLCTREWSAETLKGQSGKSEESGK